MDLGWTGITVTVVKPNGNTETLGPFRTDSTGGTTSYYTPDQVGTYKLTTNFPEQTMPLDMFDMERGDVYTCRHSDASKHYDTIDLVVQEDPLPNVSGSTSSDRILVTSNRPPTQRMVLNYRKLGE